MADGPWLAGVGGVAENPVGAADTCVGQVEDPFVAVVEKMEEHLQTSVVVEKVVC